ncbi:MAG: transposase [Actinomycetota bacterium]|nr:transposase [Actinomycetota bacterium]
MSKAKRELRRKLAREQRRVWSRQPATFTAHTARIEADATIVGTDGECKQGMDIAYNGTWGYSALMVSLANTAEPLYLSLHGANRPSQEGVVALYDRAVALCRRAGFTDVLLRGDTDFSLTSELDRWDADGVRFVFGYDARANLVARAADAPDELYHDLVARAERQIATSPRTRPRNHKDDVVRQRGYKVLRQKNEEVVEFSYRPGKCHKDYRVVALRKNISVERGHNVLFCEYRYFFYITNDRGLTADEVVAEARQRCNQENLIGQLKGGVRALHAPVNTLNANWAYMTMASLAWSIKAWCALLLPVSPRWADLHNQQRRRLLTMESAPSGRPSSTSPARSSGPPAASAGESRPGTDGWPCSSASSTPSDAAHAQRCAASSRYRLCVSDLSTPARGRERAGRHLQPVSTSHRQPRPTAVHPPNHPNHSSRPGHRDSLVSRLI